MSLEVMLHGTEKNPPIITNKPKKEKAHPISSQAGLRFLTQSAWKDAQQKGKVGRNPSHWETSIWCL
ncbi:hypothetical protein RRG08_065544 [Elysia crispata]|uniref:Uncharacterized protein n=1 Tax=Elysia crispata TaxID=231223 RepID=A0AAE1AUS5_9GAST|nr:hypothetical protein RRG08_065544 [Elysia crispata]